MKSITKKCLEGVLITSLLFSAGCKTLEKAYSPKEFKELDPVEIDRVRNDLRDDLATYELPLPRYMMPYLLC